MELVENAHIYFMIFYADHVSLYTTCYKRLLVGCETHPAFRNFSGLFVTTVPFQNLLISWKLPLSVSGF
jgi:hypothetical protein